MRTLLRLLAALHRLPADPDPCVALALAWRARP